MCSLLLRNELQCSQAYAQPARLNKTALWARLVPQTSDIWQTIKHFLAFYFVILCSFISFPNRWQRVNASQLLFCGENLGRIFITTGHLSSSDIRKNETGDQFLMKRTKAQHQYSSCLCFCLSVATWTDQMTSCESYMQVPPYLTIIGHVVLPACSQIKPLDSLSRLSVSLLQPWKDEVWFRCYSCHFSLLSVPQCRVQRCSNGKNQWILTHQQKQFSPPKQGYSRKQQFSVH